MCSVFLMEIEETVNEGSDPGFEVRGRHCVWGRLEAPKWGPRSEAPGSSWILEIIYGNNEVFKFTRLC